MQSFQELLSRLFIFLQRRAPSRMDADEILSESIMSFVSYVEHRDVMIDRAEFAPVLFGIAKRKMADHWREQRRQREVLVADVPADTPSKESSPEDVALLHDELNRALSTLPHRQREAILLQLNDYSTAEISQILGISKRATLQVLTRARRQLAEAMSGGRHLSEHLLSEVVERDSFEYGSHVIKVKNFGISLREMRNKQEKPMSQYELATRIGVGRQTYARWERGESMPTRSQAAVLDSTLHADGKLITLHDSIGHPKNGSQLSGASSTQTSQVARFANKSPSATTTRPQC
ncbi:sigma-70 family RNA polymerase sigma factor [Amycolatopsis sp. DG1A-15b]|nr:sigma-70 family RNA polymerase sigma factor [Amycolatopsis sp. DG1A-15b]WIX93549.1 sigma-70 family RNA polymerase sigma factor [Amycolatopsis sp. DG1A-15b]